MKSIGIGVFSLIFFAVSIIAQVSPSPVVEAEVRDSNSIRMRSLELERVKREANKMRPIETSKEAEVRFAEIKDDFEKIQRLQSSIVKAYTTGKNINYEKIRESAIEMRKRATRIGANFFNANVDADADQNDYTQYSKQKNVRDLIIELDNTLGVFVRRPAFTDPQVIDAKRNDEARGDLVRLIKLSLALQETAERRGR